MDASLLTDPNFWVDPHPFAPGGFDGEIPDLAELENHVLFQTSGSSGRPKWIALSKQALLLSAACVNRHLRVDEHSRWGAALPFHHVGGFGVAARAFEAACDCIHFPGKWDALEFHAWLEENRITHSSLVPTQVHDLVTAKLSAPSSLVAIVVGGGRLDIATGQAARDLGWPVLASYGMTETGSQIATQPLDLLEMPYQTGDIPLLDIWDTRNTTEGLLEISGPALFSGTLVRDGDSWIYDACSSNWYRSADLASLTDRKITPLGRADSIIKVLGELVDPEQIERELVEISKGQLAPGSFAVTAAPDERAGHRLVPVFEISSDRNLVLNVLSDYQTQAIGYRRLHPPIFVEVLPRSALGKLLRKEIANFARR